MFSCRYQKKILTRLTIFIYPAPFAVHLHSDDQTYVDPEKERTTIYRYEEDAAPMIVPFKQTIQVGIYSDLQININEMIK